MKQRERGMTFLGMVTILIILGAGIYAAIRLVPVYLDYMKVARSLEQVGQEHAAGDTNPQLIRRSLEKRWDVEDAKGIDWRDIEITKTKEGYDLTADYEVEEPFVANVYLLTKFEKTVTIPQ